MLPYCADEQLIRELRSLVTHGGRLPSRPDAAGKVSHLLLLPGRQAAPSFQARADRFLTALDAALRDGRLEPEGEEELTDDQRLGLRILFGTLADYRDRSVLIRRENAGELLVPSWMGKNLRNKAEDFRRRHEEPAVRLALTCLRAVYGQETEPPTDLKYDTLWEDHFHYVGSDRRLHFTRKQFTIASRVDDLQSVAILEPGSTLPGSKDRLVTGLIHDAEMTTNKAQASGYASLDSSGNIPISQLGNVPAAPVSSVNSQTGAVSLSAADVGAAATGDLTAETTRAETAEAAKVDVSQLGVANGVAGLDGVGRPIGPCDRFALDSWTATPVDVSADVQTVIDAIWTLAASNGGSGGTITFGPGLYYGSFKMRPGVNINGNGYGTVFRAMPSQTADILDYHTYDAYHVTISNIRIDGNAQNGAACRGIGMTSSTEPAWNANPLENVIPFPNGASNDEPPSEFTTWDNPNNTVDNVYVSNCAGDWACYFGTNQRALQVYNLKGEANPAGAAIIQCTDGQFEGLDLGSCSDGILIQGTSNKLINCKSWYHGVNSGYDKTSGPNATTYAGSGFTISGTGAGQANILVACESNDNDKYGFLLFGVDSSVLRGCVSNGDGLAPVLLSDVVNSDIDVTVTVGDRGVLTPTALILDQLWTTPNRIRIHVYDAAKASGYEPVRFTNGAILGLNVIDLGADTVWQTETLANGWAPQGSGFSTPAHRLLPDGRVELRGALTGGDATLAFVLPDGCRPNVAIYLVILTSGGFGYAVIGTDGGVNLNTISGAGAVLSVLDGLTFPVSGP